MGHIFISYSHKDKDYVHKLQEVLQTEGFEIWIDDRIDYGAEWPKVIQDRLDECEVFIVVVSENAYKSKWVQNEVARAGRKKKPIFPLLLHGEPWLSVEATQYIDVSDGSLPSSKFYERLSGFISPGRKNEERSSVRLDYPLPQIPVEVDAQEIVRFFEFIERVLDERFKTLENAGVATQKTVTAGEKYSYQIRYKDTLIYHFAMQRSDTGTFRVSFLDGWVEPVHKNSATAFGTIHSTLDNTTPRIQITNLSLLETTVRSADLTYEEFVERIWTKACNVIEQTRKQLR